MMYEKILREGEELLYGSLTLNGYIQEVGNENILEDSGGFSSRKISVFLLLPIEDLTGIEIKIQKNRVITRNGTNYIIDETSSKKGMYQDYIKLICYEEVKNTPQEILKCSIEDKLESMAEKVFKEHTNFSFVSKLKTRTQEEYEALTYPRIMYDFYLGDNLNSVSRSRIIKCCDGKFYEIDTHDREVNFTFEFYSDANSRASLIEFEDFLCNTRELTLKLTEFFKEDMDIISIYPQGHTANLSDSSNYINNQGRRRKLISLTLGINYIRKKEVTDFVESLKVTKESDINNAKDNEIKN